MWNKIRNIAIALAVGMGSLAAVPASADNLVLRAGERGIAVEIRDRGHDRWDRHDRRHGRDRWHGPRHRACSPNQAVHKASRMGIRHARVQRATQRVITVGGRSRGHFVRVAFARAPGCPVIY